jgi:hypothetical protein
MSVENLKICLNEEKSLITCFWATTLPKGDTSGQKMMAEVNKIIYLMVENFLDWFGFMVFNATFNNISVISLLSVLLVVELENTTDLSQFSGFLRILQFPPPIKVKNRRKPQTCDRSVVF